MKRVIPPMLYLLLAVALIWPLTHPLEAGAQGDVNTLVDEALRVLGAEQGALPVGSSTIEGRLVARKLTQQALTLDPSNPEAHVRMGQVWLEEGRYGAAIEEFSAAIRLQPHDAKAHTNLGVALAAMGQYAQAIDKHKEALRWQPGLAEAYSNLGTALIGAGRRDEAIDAYRTALRFKPELASAHLNLGLALVEIGHRGDAAEAFLTYLRVAQQSPAEQDMIPRVVLWVRALQP